MPSAYRHYGAGAGILDQEVGMSPIELTSGGGGECRAPQQGPASAPLQFGNLK